MQFISKKFFKETVLLIVVVVTLHLLALAKNMYWSVEEFDSLMHFLGGAMVGFFFIFLFYSSGLFRPMEVTLWRFLGIAILGTIFVSVAWEIYELLAGTALAGESNYFNDTTLDFVMDGLGAVAACMYAFSREVMIEKEKIK